MNLPLYSNDYLYINKKKMLYYIKRICLLVVQLDNERKILEIIQMF